MAAKPSAASIAPTKPSLPLATARFLAGPLLTLAAGLWMRSAVNTPWFVPDPPAVLVFFLVLSAFVGGPVSGLLSGGIGWFFTTLTLSTPEIFLHFTDENRRRALIWTLMLPTIVLLVARLRKRDAEQTAQLLEAKEALNRQAAELASALERESRALSETDWNLKKILENVPIVLFAIDKNGIITLSEGKGLARLGINPGDSVGKSVYVKYKDNPGVISATKRALAGEAFTTSTQVGEVYFETRYYPARDQKDGAVTGLVGIAYDVTDRKLAEKHAREHGETP